MKDWDPGQYLRFKTERTQPSIDLVSRIEINEPKNIIDVGCGPGNSTQILVNRWSGAKITGLDSSRAMIDRARADFPDQEWIVGDAADFKYGNNYDLVFSNATLQWLPDHEKLIPVLFQAVNSKGALAVQIPEFNKMQINIAIEQVAGREPWLKYAKGCKELLTYKDPGFYYDTLSKYTDRIELWETFYFHILDSREGIIDFIKPTGLRPYLDSLPDEEMRAGFLNELLGECKKQYPARPNGKVLFPFHRMFFIAYK